MSDKPMTQNDEVREKISDLLNRADITDDNGNTVPADGVPGIILDPIMEIVTNAIATAKREVAEKEQQRILYNLQKHGAGVDLISWEKIIKESEGNNTP